MNILFDYKICTFDCVYCEIGKTHKNNLVSPDYEIDIPPAPQFRKELNSILKYFPHLDSISFSGYYGEPTLNIHLEKYLNIARNVRDKRKWEKNKPLLTLFTNSSTLYKNKVRKVAKQFDVVLAKLDGATQEDFLRTVRPHKKVSSIENIIKAIAKLKNEMPNKNKLIIQSLLYRSYHNDFSPNTNNKNIRALAKAIKIIKPHRLQIYTIARTPAEYYVYSLDKTKMNTIIKELKNLVNDESIQIMGYR